MSPEDDTDDLRTRIKHALQRRCITGIYCLFLGRGITRLAAVQVRFTNETQAAAYVIVYRPKHGGQAASLVAEVIRRCWPARYSRPAKR